MVDLLILLQILSYASIYEASELHLNFALFHNPSYGALGITQSWIEKADEASRRRTRSLYSEFDRFIALGQRSIPGVLVSLLRRPMLV